MHFLQLLLRLDSFRYKGCTGISHVVLQIIDLQLLQLIMPEKQTLQ